MDELTLTRELGDETPLPTADRLAPARDQLMTDLSRPTKKRWIGAGAATLVAAAVTGIMVLPSAKPDMSKKPVLRPAAQVLTEAATATLTQADVVPKKNEFLYRADYSPGSRKPTSEMWKSIDGSRTGQVIQYGPTGPDRFDLPGCPASKKPVEQGGCGYDPAYLPDLPTTAEGMLAYLDRTANHESQQTLTNSMAKYIWDLSSNHYLRPAQRAALFRAAATVDGLQVVPGVADAAGRTGTGVSWKYYGSGMTWIFDPKTHLYLGTPEQTSRTAIVKQVGARP